MTTLTASTNFTTGGVLSWAIPIALVLVVLVWCGRRADDPGVQGQ